MNAGLCTNDAYIRVAKPQIYSIIFPVICFKIQIMSEQLKQMDLYVKCYLSASLERG